jgi:hypothetical protein
MTMSALPIWASDAGPAARRAARAAGWRRRDLWWERLQERANRELEAGDTHRAARRFLIAWWLARALLPEADPRRATSLANAGLAARLRGAERTAARRYGDARALWSHVAATLEGIEIRPRARSSLFHLRMELRHGETYRANMRARLGRFVAEAGDALEAIARGEPPSVRLHARWRGEKPAVFDDTRKLLAACLLIATDREPDSKG